MLTHNEMPEEHEAVRVDDTNNVVNEISQLVITNLRCFAVLRTKEDPPLG